MPSIKRRSDGDPRAEVVERASSNLRPSATNKRLRLSSEGVNGRASREDTVWSEGEPPSTQYQATGSNLLTYENARDEVSDLSTDEDADRLDEATQRYHRNKRKVAENLAAEAGILQTLTAQNFMCHKKLEVTFGPLINFIIGHNGSGKSAVLTGITICLGGKATSTNRGQSLKAFVREGANNAILIVKIKNQGVGAYKRDLYGDAIIVERHFNIQGQQGYKIKSKDGRIISTKKAELNDITDFFALQLDNPVNVLTQDQARQFLNNSSHAEKYRFFMKGVQLEQLDQDYSLLGEMLDSIEHSLDNVKDDCRSLKEKHDAAKKKFERSKKQETLRERIRAIARQLAWIQVQDQEQELEACEQTIQQRRENAAAKEDELLNLIATFDTSNSVYEEAKNEYERIEAEKAPIETRHQDAKETFEKVRDDISGCQTTQREIKQTLDSEKRSMQEAQRAVDDEYQRLSDRSDGREIEKRNEILEAENSLTDIQQRGREHDASFASLEQTETETVDREEKARMQTDQRQRAMREGQRKLQQLQNDSGDKFAPFDNSLRNVIKAIEQEKRFKARPIGPLAWHVRNKQPEWQSMIEQTFGGLLDNFIVTNREDQSLLSSILRRCNCRYSVLIGNPNFHMPQLHEPDARFNTMFRALEIDNALVRNQLIINTALEQTILVDSTREAITLTEGHLPRNCKAVMCPHPKERNKGFRYMVGRGGSQKMEPVESWRRPPRMKTDNEAAIRSQQKDVDRLTEALVRAEEETRAAQQSLKEARQALAMHKRQKKDLQLEAQRTEDRIAELQTELEQMQPQDGRLEGLKTQLEDQKQQVHHLSEQLEQAKAEREDIALKNRDNKRLLDELTTTLESKDKEISEAKKKRDKYQDRRVQALRQKNQAEHERQDANKEIEIAERARDEQAKQVEVYTEQASKISTRVPVEPGVSHSTLEQRMDRMKEEETRWQRDIGGSDADIAEQYKKAKEEHQNAEKHFKNQRDLLNTLTQSLLTRTEAWNHFRRLITVSARIIFADLMRQRGYEGKMLVDHTSKQLELQVNPDSKRTKGEGRQTKTLSGGEKSFSTVCMLLALWEAMGSPIRCLDEFDVFMDSVNRDLSMKMMIEAARQAVGKQFILITPQAMGGVEFGNDVKIVRLADPERGQATLNMPGA